MSPDEKAMLIAVTFIMLCLYTLITFQDFSFDIDLPLVDSTISFSLSENLLFFVPPSLFVAFLIFLKVRKEREAGEQQSV